MLQELRELVSTTMKEIVGTEAYKEEPTFKVKMPDGEVKEFKNLKEAKACLMK
jgi:hypothetical protein